MKNKIELGDKVECIYTGFTGIAVAKTEFINGCVQFNVAPKWNGKNIPLVDEIGVDESSLKIIQKAKKKKEEDEEDNGGPMKRAVSFKGY